MKTVILMTIFLTGALISAAKADEYVQGHTRNDGAYIEGYHRTTADSTPTNNYSYPGNVNPYHDQNNNFGTQMGSFAPSYSHHRR